MMSGTIRLLLQGCPEGYSGESWKGSKHVVDLPVKGRGKQPPCRGVGRTLKVDGLVISQSTNRDLHTHQDSHFGIYNHAKYIIYRILTLGPM